MKPASTNDVEEIDEKLNPQFDGVATQPISSILDRSHCGLDSCKKFLPKEKQKLCARCKSIAYCSRQCQKSDWKSHKNKCVSVDGKPLKITKKVTSSASNAVNVDRVRAYLYLKALVCTDGGQGLKLPDLPGWPMRDHWPVSQEKLSWFHLSRYYYRYPGFIFDFNATAPSDKIEKWNDLAGSMEAFDWEYAEDPLVYIDQIKPFSIAGNDGDAIPYALDALQNLYKLAARKWGEDSNLSEPTKEHKNYFKAALRYMDMFAATGELGCELPLGKLLLNGDRDFSFPSDKVKALELLELCSQRGGDGGNAAWILSQYYQRNMKAPGVDPMDMHQKSIKFCRIAAEQGQLPCACQVLANATLFLANQGAADKEWALEWKQLGDQGDDNYPESKIRDTNRLLTKFSKRLSRPSDEVEWNLYGFGEARHLV